MINRSAHLQTVGQRVNPLYSHLIRELEKHTGMPVTIHGLPVRKGSE